MFKFTNEEFNCITLAFIGVLKRVITVDGGKDDCITLAFIGVLKHCKVVTYVDVDCITLAFIGVLKPKILF